MRPGCVLVVSGIVALLGVGGAALWIGSRLTQEPDVVAAQGSPEDGLRAQQKIFELIRGEDSRPRSRPHQVVMTEAELNRFLSKNLVEVAKMPFAVRGTSLGRGWSRRIQGLVAAPRSPLGLALDAAREPRPDRMARAARSGSISTHRASLELGATRSQRRYLRFEVRALRDRPPADYQSRSWRLLPNPAVQALLRWRMPESVEALTVDPGPS